LANNCNFHRFASDGTGLFGIDTTLAIAPVTGMSSTPVVSRSLAIDLRGEGITAA